jgi:flagellar hook-basal body complex protein FliE
MAIDPVNAQEAMKAYAAMLNQTNNTQKPPPVTIQQSTEFQAMLKTNFNKFADMSPNQILNAVNDARNRAINPSIIEDVVRISSHNLADPVRKQEEVVRRSLRGEATLQEVLLATSEAGNAVKTATALRNKFFDAFDKIMSMQL